MMSNSMRFILAAILILIPTAAFAQKEAPKVVANNLPGTVIASVLLSTSPVTDEMDVDGYSLLKLQTRFTRGGAATNIGFTCEESDDLTTWSKITKTAPDDSVTELHPVYTTSVSINWSIRLDVTLFKNVRCTFSGAGAAADDSVVVVATRGRGI